MAAASAGLVTLAPPVVVNTMRAEALPTSACGMRCLSRSMARCDSVPGIEMVDAMGRCSTAAPTPRSASTVTQATRTRMRWR